MFSMERIFSNVKNFDDTVYKNSHYSLRKPLISKDAFQTKISKMFAMENKAMAQVISLAQKCEDTSV